jgi:hypothetical protein
VKINKVTAAQDDDFVGPSTAIRLTAFESFPYQRIVIPTGA